MKIAVDIARVFENDDTDSREFTDAAFEIDDKGNLRVLSNIRKELIGYFPVAKWDCVYRLEEEE